MTKTELLEAVEKSRAVLKAALLLNTPEAETCPELVHALLAIAEELLPKT
jgi:hypothetical protein